MYIGFWGLCALSLILLGHAVYCVVTTTKEKNLQSLDKGRKAVLACWMGLCGLALCGGVVLQLLQADAAVVHVMGLAVLLTAFALNGRVRRYLPEMMKKEEQEETNHE